MQTRVRLTYSTGVSSEEDLVDVLMANGGDPDFPADELMAAIERGDSYRLDCCNGLFCDVEVVE